MTNNIFKCGNVSLAALYDERYCDEMFDRVRHSWSKPYQKKTTGFDNSSTKTMASMSKCFVKEGKSRFLLRGEFRVRYLWFDSAASPWSGIQS